jgi:hypothetical protein
VKPGIPRALGGAGQRAASANAAAMADLDLPAKLADHEAYCVAKRRLYAPLAGLCWLASWAVAAVVAGTLGFSGGSFQAVVWAILAVLAADAWLQLRAYAERDAHLAGIATGTAQRTPATLAARRRWMRRGLLPAEGPDPLRLPLRILTAAPRLSAAAWHAPDDQLRWTHGDLARAATLVHVIGARGEGWAPVAIAGADADLLPGLAALGMVELRLGDSGGEVRVAPLLWGRLFSAKKPARDVFVLPSEG